MWDDEASYVVVDDVPWENFVKSGYKKPLLGAQRDFQVTGKYRPVKPIRGGIPCIFITNDRPLLDSWDRGNVLVYDIGSDKLY
jgi:hypothetical protein